MDAETLLKALLDASVSRRQGMWYQHGTDAQQEALSALEDVLEDTFRALGLPVPGEEHFIKPPPEWGRPQL